MAAWCCIDCAHVKQGSPLYYLALAYRELPFGFRHPVAARRLRNQTNFVVGGQSNIGQWFFEPNTDALSTFTRRYDALSGGEYPSELWNVCSGGSALLAENAQRNAEAYHADADLCGKIRNNFWIDMSTGNMGRAFAVAAKRLRMLRRKKMRFQAILWAQGEADVAYLEPATVERYRTGLRIVLDKLRHAAGCKKIFIQEIGSMTAASPRYQDRVSLMRGIQRDIGCDPDIEIASTTFDLPLCDEVHLTPEGYRIAADRMAVAIASDERSPVLESAVRCGKAVVELRFALGRRQTLDDPPDDVAITVRDSGGPIELKSIRLSGASCILIECDFAQEPVTIDYAMKDVPSASTQIGYLMASGPLKSLPVRPFRVII